MAATLEDSRDKCQAGQTWDLWDLLRCVAAAWNTFSWWKTLKWDWITQDSASPCNSEISFCEGDTWQLGSHVPPSLFPKWKLAFVHLETNIALLSLLSQLCSWWKFPAVSPEVCTCTWCTAQPPGGASFGHTDSQCRLITGVIQTAPSASLPLLLEISRLWGFFHLTIILIDKLLVCYYC